jgi:hypothetical protein
MRSMATVAFHSIKIDVDRLEKDATIEYVPFCLNAYFSAVLREYAESCRLRIG